MSYRFLSPKTVEMHEHDTWKGKTLEDELKGFENRSLVRVFEKWTPGFESHVLEAGCGLGAWCAWFNRRGHKAVGIERDRTVIEKTKQHNPEIDIRHGDVSKLPFADKTFDVYVSLGVIEHFEQGPHKALKEAFRVLKPGGIAFVSTPCLNLVRRCIVHPVRNLYFLFQRMRRRKNHFWEYRFTPKELRNLLQEAGFEISETGEDDYLGKERNRHIGLWADWFFLRKKGGDAWELNRMGRYVLKVMRMLPSHWYASGVVIVAQKRRD
jgi:SAM-dependent methyltransferase